MFYNFFIYLIIIQSVGKALELHIREDSKLFVRVNIKINSVRSTKGFALANGFRVNFEFRKSKMPKFLSSNHDLVKYYRHFNTKLINQAVGKLFNFYGWNGTACSKLTAREISNIPEYSYDIIGPIMKLIFRK